MSRSDEAMAAPRGVDRINAAVTRVLAWLPPWPLFAGVVLGFAACALAGRVVSERPLFENFLRFFTSIQPQHYFYPTASQLVAHVRHTVPRTKHLVLIGGASYFRGTGQNPDELWSVELQRHLGDEYAVVNFAIDQAEFTSFAAVAFRILAAEYPNIWYVANASPYSAAPLDGGEIYNYVFWDAYYKGLLPRGSVDQAAVARLAAEQRREPGGQELHLGRRFDRLAYASDLWTYVGYRYFFTVWSDEHAHEPFRARRHDREGHDPLYPQRQQEIRRDPKYIAHSENHGREVSKTGFMETPGGGWAPYPAHWDRVRQEWAGLFPPELRSRCVVVLLRGNPHFMQTFGEDDWRRTEEQLELGRQMYESLGYRVVGFPRQALTADDFLDGGHLMPSGGYKVAQVVAGRLRQLRPALEGAEASAVPVGPVELEFTLPDDRRPRLEELVAFRTAWENPAAQLSIEYLEADSARFQFRSAGGRVVLKSPTFAAPVGRRHAVKLVCPSLYPESVDSLKGAVSVNELSRLKRWLLVQLDGEAFWEVPMDGRREPQATVEFAGLAAAATGSAGEAQHPGEPAAEPARAGNGPDAGRREKFSGRWHQAVRTARPAPQFSWRIGGPRLELVVTPALHGRSFPIVATGRTSEADVLFLQVGHDGTARVGYDHWGQPAWVSAPFALPDGATHVIECRVPALAPPGSGSDAVVTLNGREIWRQAVPCYSPAPHEIYFGENPMGATAGEMTFPSAVFSGVLEPAWAP